MTAPKNVTSDFQNAIDILMTDFDSRSIAINLAKQHPDIFVRLARAAAPVAELKPWHSEVVRNIYQGEKVRAIKLTRENTGFGLKEAKDVCDAVAWHMSKNGYNMGNPASVALEPGMAITHYAALCAAADRARPRV